MVTHDYFDDLSDADARRGVAAERRDRMLQGCNSHMTSAKMMGLLDPLFSPFPLWDPNYS